MSLRPCPTCGTIVEEGTCPQHGRRARERARSRRRGRPYPNTHDRLRAAWKPQVAAGIVDCWRCHQRIQPGQPWDLGHDDITGEYRGPECIPCNRATSGRSQ